MTSAAPALAPAPGGAPFVLEGLSARAGDRELLRGLAFAAPRGAIAVLLGAAGAGKSTALRLALGLARPAAGRALVLGRALADTPRAERPALLQRIGVVWTGGALFPDRDVAGNVGFVLRELQGRPREEVARAVREALLLVGLKHVEHQAVDALGDGVRRRVALARAVAHRPELLLLDEPASGLDPIAADAVRTLVAQLRDRLALTVVVAARDPAWALPIADHAALLHAGRIVAEGPPAALRAASDPAAQQLLAGRAHGPIEP
ncbi:MAG: ATP-binding cassette domain-containing protein [Deltaproteobacteria bacterium]|nr:ATP-binding cassette domain-containing protein [Deltaproteobacteria bacterium]